MSPATELLQKLVRSESISGNEASCVSIYAEAARRAGFTPRVEGRNVFVEWRQVDGPALLFNSHLDTVKAGPSWTRDPWDGSIEEGRLHGLGANDAKASVAAQFGAALRLRDAGWKGNLVLCASCDEETGGDGMEKIAKRLPRYDAAVIGEPNNFAIAAGQRGLVKVRVHVPGRRAHASRPWQGSNAIHEAARFVAALEAPHLNVPDSLQHATLQVTMVEGGTQSNVVPDACVLTIDSRTTPEFDNEAMLRHIEAAADAVRGRVEVVSKRFRPVHTPKDSLLVAAAREAIPDQDVTVFPSVCDLFWVSHVPSLVMGPGQPQRSHQADEFVLLSEVEEGVGTYAAIARNWWSRACEAKERI